MGDVRHPNPSHPYLPCGPPTAPAGFPASSALWHPEEGLGGELFKLHLTTPVNVVNIVTVVKGNLHTLTLSRVKVMSWHPQLLSDVTGRLW